MRVTAGHLRGRRLTSPRGPDTRPTSDRARSSLFDWLGVGFEATRVLDLFAGTGSLGIEALSRGAAHATFVERSRGASGALRRNLADLELVDCTRVLAYDVRRGLDVLRGEGARFDWVFADPPYAHEWQERRPFAELLSEEGSLVLERSMRDPQDAPARDLVLVDSRGVGETRFDRYAVGASAAKRA